MLVCFLEITDIFPLLFFFFFLLLLLLFFFFFFFFFFLIPISLEMFELENEKGERERVSGETVEIVDEYAGN